MSLGTDINHAEIIVDEAIIQGITYFDTADLYDYGENEKIVGQLLKNIKINMISSLDQKSVIILIKINKNTFGILLKNTLWKALKNRYKDWILNN